jgi:hypothetical protein
MSNAPSVLDLPIPYVGKDSVIVGNGASLTITHTGCLFPTPKLHLYISPKIYFPLVN